MFRVHATHVAADPGRVRDVVGIVVIRTASMSMSFHRSSLLDCAHVMCVCSALMAESVTWNCFHALPCGRVRDVAVVDSRAKGCISWSRSWLL